MVQDRCLVRIGALTLALLVTGGLASDVLRKENLDLPYDAISLSEDGEAAPELVIFYGNAYEADAVVFALDESGSMDEQGRWRIQTREVARAINEMSERAEFGVVFYGSNVRPFRRAPERATPGNKGAAYAFIESRRPGGDTCLFEGLIEALETVKRSASNRRAVILTSDGRPDVCATGNAATPGQIRALIAKSLGANPGRLIKVHTIWVGASTNRQAIDFMKQLAAAHGGSFRQVRR